MKKRISLQNRLNKCVLDTTESTAISAVQASYNVQAAAIVTLTTSGDTAIKCAKYRPHCPVLAVSRVEQVARQLQLHRGVIPLLYRKDREADWTQDVDARVQFAIDFGKTSGFIQAGQRVVCVTGWRSGSGSSNTVRIM